MFLANKIGKKVILKHIVKYSRKLSLVALIIWSVIILISTITQLKLNRNSIESITKHQAEIAYDKDMLYRKWASSHGGVYVPITDITLPNPALSHLKERDIETPSGIKLTLVNPAYMTRQVHEISEEHYELKGHITSLNPINKNNKPDPWEIKSLKLFESGETKITEFVVEDGFRYLRLMNALITEDSCLKCHAIQGYKAGDVRGGLSVSVPMADLEITFSELNSFLNIRHLIIWLLGVGVIILLGSVYRKRIEVQIEYTKGLDDEREYLSVALKSIGEGVIVTDINGNITRMNKIAEQLTGWSILEAEEKNISKVFSLISIEQYPKKIDILNSILTKKIDGVFNNNYILNSLEGKKIHINNTGSIIYTKTGDILGIILIFRDMTAENDIQQKLCQSQKLDAIGQLTSGIAHDFNNMIGGIMGGAELLQKHLSNDEKSQKYLSIILNSSKRATDLTKKLLSFSKSQNLDIQPIDLHKAITATVALLENTIDKNVIIQADLKSKNSIILGNSTQLQNIFMNLGINSSHAMPQGGTLSYTTKDLVLSMEYCKNNPFEILPGNYIEVEISDTGLGIPNEVLPHIFDSFFTTKEQGTGLGLFVIYGTIKKLKGSITVLSSIEKGTIFKILLPVSDIPMKSVINIKDKSYYGKGLILLVDDEEILRVIGKDILEELGYSVILSHNGKDAENIYKFNEEKIDLIILDMIMPVMNGRDCLKNIRKIDSEIPILIASGYRHNGDIEEFNELNCSGFISKPYSVSEISRLISELVPK